MSNPTNFADYIRQLIAAESMERDEMRYRQQAPVPVPVPVYAIPDANEQIQIWEHLNQQVQNEEEQEEPIFEIIHLDANQQIQIQEHLNQQVQHGEEQEEEQEQEEQKQEEKQEGVINEDSHSDIAARFEDFYGSSNNNNQNENQDLDVTNEYEELFESFNNESLNSAEAENPDDVKNPDNVDRFEVYNTALESIIITDLNYDFICTRIMDMLEMDEVKSIVEIIESKIISRLFDDAMSEEITKEKIITEENKICSFLELMGEICSMYTELKYLFAGMYVKILDVYEKHIDYFNESKDEDNSNVEKTMITFYFLAGFDQEYVDILVDRKYPEKIIKRIEQMDNTQSPSKYGLFESITFEICLLTKGDKSSLAIMCKKFIDSDIVKYIQQLYTTICENDITTKLNLVSIVVNLISHGYWNNSINNFLVNVLAMNEIEAINSDEKEEVKRYDYFINISCSIMNDILERTNTLSEIEKIRIVKNLDIVGHNIVTIVNDTCGIKFSDDTVSEFKKLSEKMAFYLLRQN